MPTHKFDEKYYELTSTIFFLSDVEYDGVVEEVWESFCENGWNMLAVYYVDYWCGKRDQIDWEKFNFVIKVDDLFCKFFWGMLIDNWTTLWVYGGVVLWNMVIIIFIMDLDEWKSLFWLVDEWKSDDSGVCIIVEFFC